MVEFGLKLEDNKVAEWSDKYLQYEKLKKILKKAKAAEKSFQELSKRRPADAKRIQEAYKNGVQQYVTVTPTSSSVNLATRGEQATEQTALLGRADSMGSKDMSSSGRTSFPGLSDISDYFGGRYERHVRDALKVIDDLDKDFETLLLADIKTVQNFYYEKLEELHSRFQVLIESVAASMATRKYSYENQVSDDAMELQPLESTKASSGAHHSRGQSLMEMMTKISTMIKKEAGIDALKAGDDSDDEGEPTVALPIDNQAGEFDSIKRALVDQYRSAKLLHNFVIMNYTGFVKIVKKHDKTIPEHKGRYKEAILPKNLCDEGKEVEALAEKHEKYFASWFCDGDVRAAHAQMFSKRGDGLEMDWSQLRLGYRMGMCAVLALWVCWDSIWGLVAHGDATIGGRSAFPVFRACGGILLLQWFWGCSVFVWTRYRVNYIYLFDFNPRIVATPLGIFEDAVDNTLIFFVLMLLYYKAGSHNIPHVIPTGGYPFILCLFTVYKLIFPLRTRLPMWSAIGKVVTAPMHSPTFFHGYIGDIFTSMVKVFQDIAWTIGWMVSGDFLISEDLQISSKHKWASEDWYKGVLIPIICLMPLVIRFNQCLRRYIDTGDRFPHLANATKYALSQTVTLFGAFHPLYMEHENHREGSFNLFQMFWLTVFVVSSLYSFTWDVYMDWGLGRREYTYLGQSLMYPRRSYYYVIIALDLVLRSMWVLTLLPPQSGAKFEVPQYLTAVTMMLELFRRTIWGFLRLENEHRSNAAGFRRVSFVPLHFNTGHKHQYKEEKEHRGSSVLAEVVAVTICVLGVCAFSIVSAQRANRLISNDSSEL